MAFCRERCPQRSAKNSEFIMRNAELMTGCARNRIYSFCGENPIINNTRIGWGGGLLPPKNRPQNTWNFTAACGQAALHWTNCSAKTDKLPQSLRDSVSAPASVGASELALRGCHRQPAPSRGSLNSKPRLRRKLTARLASFGKGGGTAKP